MSRLVAKSSLKMKDYKERMKNVYSTNISAQTIDESPMAYKTLEDITKSLEDICCYERLVPVYNYKN